MSNVMRFFDPSSPVTNAAWIDDVSLASGFARDAPESTQLRSRLKSMTFVL
jgi:hypothetical protein